MSKSADVKFEWSKCLADWNRIAFAAAITITMFGQGNAQAVELRKLKTPKPDKTLAVRAGTATPASSIAAAPFPLSSTFTLHSRPTATKVIYLCFTGFTTENTSWNDSAKPSIVTAPFSLDSSSAFSNTELTMIQDIWQRVSECYSPFDVDVTTQQPATADLINSGSSDTRWGIRVLIGESTPSPAPDAGGVAFIGSFSWNSDTPCYVFPASLSNVSKYISDASVHEVGHTLGLIHDGRISPAEEYYEGQGTGVTGWAPHMGVGYYKNLVQFSKGEYKSANNTEDDLNIIVTQNGFTYRTDDYASDRTTAIAIGGAIGTGTNANRFIVSQSGVIEKRTDTDYFKITSASGQLTFSAVGGPVNTMLDIQMDLLNSAGTVIATSNPTDSLTASITQTVTAGTYYIRIDGVGNGDPLATGYTDYGSLGQYTITGSYTYKETVPTSNVTATYTVATKTLTLTGDDLANALTVSYQNGVIKVEGANSTKINNTTLFSSVHSGKLVIVANLNGGNDSLAVIGVDSSTATVNMGGGNDSVALTLSNFTTLTVNGGDGTDTLLTTSTKIGTLNRVSVP